MNAYDIGLLVLRLCLGLTMATHGYNTISGSNGIAGTASWFDSIGMRPGRMHARLAAGCEIGCGLALALGFLTPVAAMLGAGRFGIDRLLFGAGGFGGWPGLFVAAGLGVAAGAGQLLLFYRPATAGS